MLGGVRAENQGVASRSRCSSGRYAGRRGRQVAPAEQAPAGREPLEGDGMAILNPNSPVALLKERLRALKKSSVGNEGTALAALTRERSLAGRRKENQGGVGQTASTPRAGTDTIDAEGRADAHG